MIYLATLILLPILGGLFAYAISGRSAAWTRLITLAVLSANIVVTFCAFGIEGYWDWIPSLGASFHLSLDGLSFVLVLLANVVTLVGVANISEHSRKREGLYYLLLLITLSGIIGVFMAFDLLLFFVFWEVMLVPLYFLILIFGEEQRQKAATRFLLLTQGSGLLLLVSIIGLYVATGGDTFDYTLLLKRAIIGDEVLISLGFLLAFLVKLPALPFHFWMPSVFTNSPVSALMTGILIKTGAYGLIRFYVPLFPQASKELGPSMMILGIVGLIYGALVAYSQRDIKKILAYSTISHVGLILAGIFSGHLATTGVVILLVTQAIGTGALLMLCNHVYASTRTRELGRFSGLYHSMPKAGTIALIFAMASIGLPGLGNFVGEWLVLVGVFAKDPVLGVIAAIGIVMSALYMLRFMHGIFFGEQTGVTAPVDLSSKSVLLYSVFILIVVGIGLYPSPLIDVIVSWHLGTPA